MNVEPTVDALIAKMIEQEEEANRIMNGEPEIPPEEENTFKEHPIAAAKKCIIM